MHFKPKGTYMALQNLSAMIQSVSLKTQIHTIILQLLHYIFWIHKPVSKLTATRKDFFKQRKFEHEKSFLFRRGS